MSRWLNKDLNSKKGAHHSTSPVKQQWQHSKEQIELAKDKVEIEQIKLKQAQPIRW